MDLRTTKEVPDLPDPYICIYLRDSRRFWIYKFLFLFFCPDTDDRYQHNEKAGNKKGTVYNKWLSSLNPRYLSIEVYVRLKKDLVE